MDRDWLDNQIAEKDGEVMSVLKDFQRATVQRVDELFRSGQDRVLVADEVGMGKTMVAKGVIAKMARLRFEEGDDLVKIVYVCSNQAIANQNISEFDIFDTGYDDVSTTRLSMQHLLIARKERQAKDKDYIQLIPLTPATSFRQTSGQGSARERIVICAVLRRLPRFAIYSDQLEKMLIFGAPSAWSMNYQSWDDLVQEYEPYEDGVAIYDGLQSEAYTELLNDIQSHLEKRASLQKDGWGRAPGDRNLIVRLRKAFAEISVDMLNPDLVIMDEFQRFRFLINNPDPETRCLTEKFLLKKTDNLADKVRVLLLSATPYKLYSTLDELGDTNDDSHYHEFLDVMGFLNGRDPHFHDVWMNYSSALKEMTADNLSVLLLKKQEAEDAMYGTVCRTERIAVMGNGDYTDDSSKGFPLEINEDDIKSHLQAARLLQNTDLRIQFPIDYIKSCPYALSYMQKYSTKKRITAYFRKHSDEINAARSPLLWINRRKIRNYEALPPVNARLERLKKEMFKQKNAQLLLWVPPCRPYYSFGGVYKDAEDFSKILVFSSWEMVPKMISTLISYEEERRTVGELIRKNARDKDASTSTYFSTRRYPQPRLKITASSLSALALLYPSNTLANLYNPIKDMRNGLTALPSLEETLSDRINTRLADLPNPMDVRVDKRWYYLAPMLLDLHDDADYVQKWLDSLNGWSVLEGRIEDADSTVKKQLDGLLPLLLGDETVRPLGRRPEDLVQNLVNMVLGSPAVCILRSNGGDVRAATEAAYSFMNYFNSPETTAIVELANVRRNHSDDDHWEAVLSYCKNGNFQSMIDEYIHLLTRGEGLKKEAKSTYLFYQNLSTALNLHASQYVVESFNEFRQRISNRSVDDEESGKTRLRTHFAVGFSKGVQRDEKGLINEERGDRKGHVRVAFNAPFWPFVVASTSIGQEGLDFHQYCRKIMHWNLPSNPVELEQREGRINRFKCLAIRKNVANKYGDAILTDETEEKDPWNIMFRAAEHERKDGQSELIPFWCFGQNQTVKIERILAQYPISKDEAIYERLIKILSLYRLTMGQSRQEELLEYIFNEIQDVDKLKELFIDLSPFDKKEMKSISGESDFKKN